MHGSTDIRRLWPREYCAAIDHGSSAIPKLPHLNTSVLARKTVGYSVLKNQRHIDQISTKDLWDNLNNVFTKQRKIKLDRYTFLTRKQQLKGELVEKFYGCKRELSLNCDLGSQEESIIRDVFVANVQEGERHRELIKETRSAFKTS